jgi:hypothetical protein
MRAGLGHTAPLTAYDTLLVAYSRTTLAIRSIRRLMFPLPQLASSILILSPHHMISHHNSKMAPNKRSAPSSANPKKLIRPQRTQQSKNAKELARADLYDIDSDAPTAINKDDSSRSYIACEAEEILSAAGNKGVAKDTQTHLIGPSIGLDSVTVPLKLRL